MDLSASDFGGFFRAIHGYDPFPWQQHLVNQLADTDRWPDVLDLPTGSGKTAALDAAIFHLALRADEPGKAALRIALVVDRRLVVDDAFSRAQKVAKALFDSLNKEMDECAIVTEVAHRLKRLAGKDGPPLVAQRLRGGAPLEHDWARTPTQPTILCSTVDQVGSRLLFRGYGVSDRMKPVHGGLLGVNSLILLDEAHLSEPFRQTLDAVCQIGNAKIKVALLSATPGKKAKQPLNLLNLSPEDRIHPTLKTRLTARKPVVLKKPLPHSDAKNTAGAFVAEAQAMAKRLQQQSVDPAAVGIVVNRVALARNIFQLLRTSLNKESSVTNVVLLIGRSRSVDRDGIVKKALAPFRTGTEGRGQAKPLFVVATQCLEVGVDLDLDGLVTQAASLDALRQRFGRLNRAGRPVAAEGAIFTLTEDIAKKVDDPVYGDRIRRTWEALQDIANEDKIVDFGVEALADQLKQLKDKGIDPDSLSVEQPDAPVLMPAYINLWSQTWPRPTADPEVSLFLHGSERTTAGVSIVWRSDISAADLEDRREDSLNEDDLKKIIRLVPPRAAEAVEVPLWAARAWLSQVKHSFDLSDTPEREEETNETARGQGTTKHKAFRWAGPDDPATRVVSPSDLRTGDFLVVPAQYGGCDEFGWAPDSNDSVVDVADEAAKPYWGRRCAVRITRDVVRTDAQWERLSNLLAAEGVSGLDLVEDLLTALPLETGEDETDANPKPRDVRKALQELRSAKGQKGNKIDCHFPYANRHQGGAILVAEQGIRTEADGRDVGLVGSPATEDDTASQASNTPVLLDDHGHRVARFAKGFAQTLGLKEADDLGLAAYLHDAGKADPRFQVMLAGGDWWNRPDKPPLAKSGRSSWSPRAWERAGLPKGWRHEALSVRMAQLHPALAKANDPALVLWLIGTHHGFGRPFFNFLDPTPEKPLSCLDMDQWELPPDEVGPQSLAFDFEGADWSSLFEDLKRRYGIWDLAHLEAILRLADHRASEEERQL